MGTLDHDTDHDRPRRWLSRRRAQSFALAAGLALLTLTLVVAASSPTPAPAGDGAPTRAGGETPVDTRPAAESVAAAATPAQTPEPAPREEPRFAGSVAPIDSETAARMQWSWRPNCPVALSHLRLVNLTHWGFDGQPHQGELIVHQDHAEGILAVFAALFEARFPLEQVRLVDEFGGDDDRSMAANNTSGYNCRRVAGTGRWSEHAFGRAVDVNPVQNPYVLPSGEVRPPQGRAYTQRDRSVPGLITRDDPVVAAFADIGWHWGGRWRSPDYQHFSATGR